MKITRYCTAVILAFLAICFQSGANTYYVATNGTGDGTSWENATNNIQDAISLAINSADIVLVSNGVYQTGGVSNWPAGTLLTNRVAITNTIIVMSANNDPTNTIIRGEWASDDNTNGLDAVRCVYMISGSSLIGFTLTNGATLALNTPVAGTNDNHYGGGAWTSSTNSIISNCVIVGNSSAWRGGGAYYGTLNNCKLIGNSTVMNIYGGGGGGAYGANLNNCLVTNNSAHQGGGVCQCALLSGCTLANNVASRDGGGSNGGTLTNCTLIGNSAKFGGGAYYSYLNNCMIISNLAPDAAGNSAGATGRTLRNCTFIGNSAVTAGGVYAAILYNCLIIGNYAGYGGGAYNCSMYNCTIVGNEGKYAGGGGVYGSGSAGTNCIVYFNKAPADPNWYPSTVTFSNSCTITAQVNWVTGDGNITNDPLFIDKGSGYGTNDFIAGNYRLSPNSPCINKGANMDWMTNAVDLGGQRRVRYGTVDMGTYEIIYKGTVYGFQ